MVALDAPQADIHRFWSCWKQDGAENPDYCKWCYDGGEFADATMDEVIEKSAPYLQFGRVSVNRGMIVENYVAQQLRAGGHNLFYYSWDEPARDAGSSKPRPREIDFLLTRGFSDAAGKLRVSPVEAKSTKTYSTVSLDDFARRFPKRVGDELVLHTKQLKVEGGRLCFPLYMVHLL